MGEMAMTDSEFHHEEWSDTLMLGGIWQVQSSPSSQSECAPDDLIMAFYQDLQISNHPVLLVRSCPGITFHLLDIEASWLTFKRTIMPPYTNFAQARGDEKNITICTQA